MLLHCFCYCPALPEVFSNFLIRYITVSKPLSYDHRPIPIRLGNLFHLNSVVLTINLRLYQIERFFSKRARQANNPIQVSYQNVSRIDDSLLILAIQAYWFINL